jgi:(S)-2-hydroxyglutarate dehydrogenase
VSSRIGSADLAVVGAGILGLAVAREALRRFPGIEVAVLEKEASVATHQTGHSSGVIHAGVYYAPGSLKAKLCVEGSRAMYAYCDEHGIPYDRCGKVVVATDEGEVERLEELFSRSKQNGVPDVRLLDQDELAEVEPLVRGVRALHSPTTGVVDFRRVAQTMAQEITDGGAEIHTECGVRRIRRVDGGSIRLDTPDAFLEAHAVITCGGVYSDRLARMTGGAESPRIVPFRGRYYALVPQASKLVRGLVYPVPDPAFPFLGVHFTRQISGEMWAGPNAVLALAREGYRARQIALRDVWDTVSYRGFRAFARRNWRTGYEELRGDVSQRAFVAALQRLVPAVRPEHLGETHSGIRAQALDRDGSLVDDFRFDHAENVVHVRNAPSPGATSSLAIAGHIVEAAENVIRAA